MTESNRVQYVGVAETTLGTTPTTPRMLGFRTTGDTLSYRPRTITSDEIRSDRMSADPIIVADDNDGAVNFEMHYPVQGSFLSRLFESAFARAWTNAATFDNDGTADSVITDAGTTTDTYTVASGGTAAKTGHLARATGFTNAANNKVFRVASSTGTTIVGSSLSLSAEAAPPGTARIKIVGFQGASGDITATSTGLGSTALDFTTLGLAVGMWIKIGGTAAGDKFATAALNAWARITAIAANALTLDNRPTGWTTDAGASKTVKVWFGDHIYNGLTVYGQSIERGFLGQTTPTYILQKGLVVSQLDLRVPAQNKITGTFTFIGMSGAQSTTAQDASPDAAPAIASYPVMAGSVNLSRLTEAGSALSGGNIPTEIQLTLNNNARAIFGVDARAAQNVLLGECSVTGRLNAYFGDNTLLTKLLAGTPAALNSVVTKNGQAVVLQIPRLIYTGGSPTVGGKNQDVVTDMAFQASLDATTNAHIIMDRVEYYED